MYCEMCGNNVPKTQKIRIDSAILMLCDKCAKFGTPVDPPKKIQQTVVIESPSPRTPTRSPSMRPPPRPIRKPKRKAQVDPEDLYVVPEYPQIINQARSRLSWTQEDLANKLLEKKNVLAKIERGELTPDLKLARKIEKILDIKLLEKY